MFNGFVARFSRPGVLFIMLMLTVSVSAQTTAFTYQGQLSNNGVPANGSFDLQFSLFDLAQNGSQQGGTVTLTNISVVNGLFTVQLDFGSNVFTDNSAQFMQIGVRPGGSTGAFTELSPRVPFTPVPYAIRATSAATADSATTATVAATANSATNATQLGGIQANQYVLTTDNRLNASNFVQNGTSQQASANFNISGSGTLGGTLSANVINAATQYNIGGAAVLSAASLSGNTFVGTQVGTGGSLNTIVGASAGKTNTGNNNVILGAQSGQVNAGTDNVMIGVLAGSANGSGGENVFIGRSAGQSNTTGSFGIFIGSGAGSNNLAPSNNVFVGGDAGIGTTTGGFNAFFGTSAGSQNTTGQSNTFIGEESGRSNSTGSNNTALGLSAGPTVSNLTQSTAIGANATVSTSHTIVLGTSAETTNIPGTLAVVTLGSAGATALCRNASNQIATCSSSLRYKTNLAPYSRGLDVIDHLRPISFTWKDGGMRDFGFGAEEVAKIEPLLVTFNTQGQVEGVKYDRITAILVNAVKEQQTQIGTQKQQIESQQQQIDGLKRLVCEDHPAADVCKK
ncbi:MAG TPA: tail fiber domain-containing protein [Blastocatellia bacterium]|nr:tail fiber domain-containing protein [Blastocatellia bacterium]